MNNRLAFQSLLSPHQNIWAPHLKRLVFKFDDQWKKNMLNIFQGNVHIEYLIEFLLKNKEFLQKYY